MYLCDLDAAQRQSVEGAALRIGMQFTHCCDSSWVHTGQQLPVSPEHACHLSCKEVPVM